MQDIAIKIASADWQNLTEEIHNRGYAIIPGLLTSKQCRELKENYDNPNGYRKTVVMERYRFGLGEYKYFDYPLPELIQTIRETVYPKLVPIANAWMKWLLGTPGTEMRLVVTDIFGRIVESRDHLQPNTSLQLGQNWKPGINFVQVQQGNDSKVIKLVKE